MANKLYQGLIVQMKDSINREIGVVDENGVVIACSNLEKIGEIRSGIREEIAFADEILVVNGYSYRIIGDEIRTEQAIFVEGTDTIAEKLVATLAVTFNQIRSMYDEKNSKTVLIKNILLDDILPSDIYIKSKELHFALDVPRVVFLIKFHNKNDIVPYEMIQNLFPDRERDYVVGINEQNIALVKEVSLDIDCLELEEIAQGISDTLNSEFYVKVSIGVGTPVSNVKFLSRSYREAQVACEVGKIFEADKNVNSYENLGIARLIYQLPSTMCEMFMSEVFKDDAYEMLDRETLATVDRFFENSLNLSETSRKLFVHRNTLQYRLEKIQKLTGLDIRNFDHAITFKVATMVKKYMLAKPVAPKN